MLSIILSSTSLPSSRSLLVDHQSPRTGLEANPSLESHFEALPHCWHTGQYGHTIDDDDDEGICKYHHQHS